MNFINAEKYLRSIGQEHLLKYYDELNEEERDKLLKDVENTDFGVLKHINDIGQAPRGKLAPIKAVSIDEISLNREKFSAAGESLLKENKVGAVLLAGGQGSRLGSDKPKGMFNMGITRNISIFELQMNNILKVTLKTGKQFPIFIMTSKKNHDDTVDFFKKNNYFGYSQDRIFFFEQDVAPSCDFNGKVYLDEKYRVALTPNGNGGWYSSLINSGLGEILVKEGIEWLNVYSVDNVLQSICDPAFIGATVLKGCNCGAKVVKKTYAEEKVGLLCLEDGKPAVVEYYEMPENLKCLEKDGELVFNCGVILNYLFKVDSLNAILGGELPYHVAKKAIAHIENGVRVTPKEPCGYKFETLVVDMIQGMGSCLAYEVDREKEFAPVKNATGVDSVDSAREMLIKNGIEL